MNRDALEAYVLAKKNGGGGGSQGRDGKSAHEIAIENGWAGYCGRYYTIRPYTEQEIEDAITNSTTLELSSNEGYYYWPSFGGHKAIIYMADTSNLPDVSIDAVVVTESAYVVPNRTTGNLDLIIDSIGSTEYIDDIHDDTDDRAVVARSTITIDDSEKAFLQSLRDGLNPVYLTGDDVQWIIDQINNV